MKDAAKAVKSQLMTFQKCLLRGSSVSAMKGCSTGHGTHREHMQLHPLALQIGVSFIPIHLRFHAPVVTLGHEGILPAITPKSCFRRCTYCRTVGSRYRRRSAISSRIRSQIRFAVCRCLRGALRSACRI